MCIRDRDLGCRFCGLQGFDYRAALFEFAHRRCVSETVNTQRLPAFHQRDVRVDKSFFFRKWSLIFYADIQNIYNYKALGPDELVPVENPDGSYRKDPDREGYYRCV